MEIGRFSSVQSLSHVQRFATPWTAAHQGSLSIINSQSLLKLMSIESMMTSNHHILSSSSPAFNLSQHQDLFPCISTSKQVAKKKKKQKTGGQSIGTSSSASALPMNIHRLIFFRIDWFDLAVQGALKCLLQHHSSKASILWHSPFFIVQLSHTCMTTGKTTGLNRWTFVGKVLSLLFNMLSRLVIAFLPRSRHLLI